MSYEVEDEFKIKKDNKEVDDFQIDDYGRAVSKVAIAQICHEIGFVSIKESALEALSNIMVRYICDLGKSSSFYANNLGGRSQSNIFDLLNAFQDLGSNEISNISDFELPFAHPITRFPIPVIKKYSTPSFLQKGQISGSKHIPDWLPAFPDPHTYIKTPMMLEFRVDKVEQAKQRRKAKQSLLNLQQRLIDNADQFDGFRERKKHLLVEETFAPAIDAVLKGGGGTNGGSNSDAMDVDRIRRRPVIHFMKARKKMLVEDVDVHIRSMVNEKRGSFIRRDRVMNNKKRRAELILRQSAVDNNNNNP